MTVARIKYGQNNSFIVVLIFIIFNFHLCSTANPRDPGWARFCGLTKYQQYVSQDFYTDKCPGGVWLNSSANDVQWKCVCTMGSFALRFGWCQTEESISGLGSNGLARFTLPDISCVHFDSQAPSQQIQGLQALHKWSNRYKEDGPYIWTKQSGGAILNQRDLRSVRIKNLTLTSGVSTLYAIRANPKANTYYSIYSRKTSRAVCLLPPNGTTGNGSLFRYKINFLWTQNEKMPGRNSGLRRIPKHVKIEFVTKPGCYFTDKTYSFKAILPENLDEYVLPKLSPSDLHPDCVKCLSDQSPFSEPKTVENAYPADLDNVTNLNKEVDLQSQRLAIHWGDILLRNRSNPHDMNDIQEVEILKKAAIMAYGACDMNYIPKQFYQFFLILFQASLSESFLKYPPQAPLEDRVYKELSAILDTCMQKTQVYNFTVESTCPPTYSEYNEPGVGYEPIETPAEFMATPNKHDYIMEFAWKLSSFVQYHCNDEFRNAPFLHDMLQVQLDSLFQQDLILRWSHPSNSLKMLDSIFKIHLDVVVTMINFEKCISVANKKNKFEGWLKKPLNQPHSSRNVKRRKRSVHHSARVGTEVKGADRYVRRRASMLIESVPVETFQGKQANRIDSPRSKIQPKSVSIKKPVYKPKQQLLKQGKSGPKKQIKAGFERSVRQSNRLGYVRSPRQTEQSEDVPSENSAPKLDVEEISTEGPLGSRSLNDESATEILDIINDGSTEGPKHTILVNSGGDFDFPVMDIPQDSATDISTGPGSTVEASNKATDGMGNPETGLGDPGLTEGTKEDQNNQGSEGSAVTENSGGPAGMVSTALPLEGNSGVSGSTGFETLIVFPETDNSEKPGGSGYTGSKPLIDFPETDNSEKPGGSGYTGSKPLIDFPETDNSGKPGGSGYTGSKPLIDFPETDNGKPGGSGYTGSKPLIDFPETDNGRPGGSGYTGSKPLLDFPETDNGRPGGSGYTGSKPLMDFPGDEVPDELLDFPDEYENYDKETMGHFRGAFACLYSITDFAAQNSEYPLYNNVCWD